MRLGKEAPAFSPAFRDLFLLVRELAGDKKLPQDDDDLIEWHLAHPLWNLQYKNTSTGLNQIASGVRPEGGEPHTWPEDILYRNTHQTISIGHLGLIDLEDEFDEIGKGGCDNELTVEGQVLQSGEPFYDPDWDGARASFIVPRILEEAEIRRLISHIEGW